MNLIQDLYPSRKSTAATMMERPDPVVWGDGKDGPLSPDDVAAFDRDGYLWLPGFLSDDDVAALRAERDRLWQAHATDTADEVVREPGGDEIRSIFRVHETSPVFRAIAAQDRFAGRARQLLGSSVYVHQSRINDKPGFRGKEFYWHSDFETWHVEDGVPRMRMVSCAITLTENTLFNGSLMVLPGSHRTYVQCAGGAPTEDHFRTSLRKQEFGVPDDASMRVLVDRHGLKMPTGPAGSVLLFDCNIMHGSNGNISPDARSNLFFVYNSVHNTPLAPFGPQALRPAFLGSRDFTPTEAW